MKCWELVEGDLHSYHNNAKWVRNVIIEEHGLVIPFDAYNSKISEWDERLYNFKYFKDYPHVLYDTKPNSIWAHESTWAKVLKVMKYNFYICISIGPNICTP